MKIFFRKFWLKMKLHFIVYQCVTCSYIDKKQQKNWTNLGISCFEQQKRILKWSLFGTEQENVSLEPRNTILCLVKMWRFCLSCLKCQPHCLIAWYSRYSWSMDLVATGHGHRHHSALLLNLKNEKNEKKWNTGNVICLHLFYVG